MNVDASTRLFAVLGDPVAHSRSPAMHNAALAATGCNAVFLALRCDAALLAPLMRALARAGGGGNITVPHKQAAAAALDVASPLVLATGACNTFLLVAGQLYGENTDVAGFVAAAERLVGPLAGIRALILGAGGAARAAAVALLRNHAASITIASRRASAVDDLIARIEGARPTASAAAPAALSGAHFDLVVNATPLGLADSDPLPIDLATLAHAGAALDLTYGSAGDTPWTRHARALGVPAAHGLDMLVEQGAAAFELWTGHTAPRAVMRAAVRTD